MGNRTSHLQQLLLVALEVTSLTVHGIALAGAVTDNPEERATLLERLDRQKIILERFDTTENSVWRGLFAALLDLADPIFRNRRGSSHTTEDICALLGHAPADASVADLDVASQILQVVWQMIRLSGAYPNMKEAERLSKQHAIADSVTIIHGKLLGIAETLEEEEYEALRRLFFRVFGLYYDPMTASRFSAANTKSRKSPTPTPTSTYGTMQSMPRQQTRGRVSYMSVPGRFYAY